MFSVNTQRALFNQAVVGSLLILPTTTDYTRLPRLQRKKKKEGKTFLFKDRGAFAVIRKERSGDVIQGALCFGRMKKKQFLFRCDETTKRTVLFFRRNFTPVVCDWFKLVWLVGSGGRRGSKNVLSSAESSLSSSFPLSFLETLPFLIFLSTPSLKTAFYSGRGYLFADEAILIAQRLH